MNAKQTNKYYSLQLRFAQPKGMSDLNITFMECMEQIEFAGNDNNVREIFSIQFNRARQQWFPTKDRGDFFDDIYNQVEQLVA